MEHVTMTKKYSTEKHMNELVSMIMYTRKIENKSGIKKRFGIIDEQQETYEKKLKEVI